MRPLLLVCCLLLFSLNSMAANNLQKRLRDQELEYVKKQQNSPEALEQIGRDIEAIFTQQVLKDIYANVPFDPLAQDTSIQELYRQLLIEEIAKQMAKKNGMGIASKITDDLKKRLKTNAQPSDEFTQVNEPPK